MMIWHRPHRQLRKAKKSKWVDDSLSKPTKECRIAKHTECPIPERCPCYCHRQAEIKIRRKGDNK